MCALPADLTSPPCDACLLSLLRGVGSLQPSSFGRALSRLFSHPPPFPGGPPFLHLSALRPLGPTRPDPTHRRRGAGRARPARRAGAACCRPAERSAESARRRAPGPAPARPQEMLAARAKIPGRLRALRLARPAPSRDPAGGGVGVPTPGASPAGGRRPPSLRRPGARAQEGGRGEGCPPPPPPPRGHRSPARVFAGAHLRPADRGFPGVTPSSRTPNAPSVEAFIRPPTHFNS